MSAPWLKNAPQAAGMHTVTYDPSEATITIIGGTVARDLGLSPSGTLTALTALTPPALAARNGPLSMNRPELISHTCSDDCVYLHPQSDRGHTGPCVTEAEWERDRLRQVQEELDERERERNRESVRVYDNGKRNYDGNPYGF